MTTQSAAITLREDQYSNLAKLATGAFSPLTGFMDERAFLSVTDNFSLPDGSFFPFPLALDVRPETADTISTAVRVPLLFDGVEVGELRPTGVFTIDRPVIATKLFGSSDPQHPGVRQFFNLHSHFVGGDVTLTRPPRYDHSDRELLPVEAKALFAAKGWKTIVGFATRNVPHRGHEYLQRVALEHVDGLFVQATIGVPASSGFTAQAIVAGYDALIDGCYGSDRAVVSPVSTPSYQAGPREALLQAVVRRNYGCTHFIIGRDHSGVGGYYADYDAHQLSTRYEDRMGITVLRMHGPFFCTVCDGVVTERHCRHRDDRTARLELKATAIREAIAGGGIVDPRLMRPSVVDAIRRVQTFH